MKNGMKKWFKYMFLPAVMAAGMLGAAVYSMPVACHAKETEMAPVYGEDITEGSYQVEMTSSSSMFRIVDAQLDVKDGSMTAVITLSGTGYLKLYMGTKEEAENVGEENFIPYVEDADGAYTYTIPVEALNQEFDCAAFSRRKETWYDRQLSVLASSLPEEALLIELPESAETKDAENGSRKINKELSDIESIQADAGAESAEDQAGEAGEKEAEEDRTADADTEPAKMENPALVPVQMPEKDGSYTMEVTLNGGSGKASITSPALIKITNGTAAAVIEWSSPHYDYMIVNGKQYLPVSAGAEEAGEHSVFEIPVLVLDQEIPVIADTTAMSRPHEVAYTLTFHADTMEKAGSVGLAGLWTAAGIAGVIVLAVCIGTAVCVIRRRKKEKK